MYQIGICDDGKYICATIEAMIMQYAEIKELPVEVMVWYTGEGLVDYLKKGNRIDILFLDIELAELSGIEVGSFIRNQLEDRGMQILYISAKASYAQKLFKTQPLDFLIKPILQEQMNEVLELAVKIVGRNAEKFQFQCGRDYYYIPFGDIMYFVSEGRKIKIMTVHGEREFYGKIKELITKLSEDFIMIHQSYAVNKNHISRYTYETVELTDGTILAISRVNRKQVREKLLWEG